MSATGLLALNFCDLILRITSISQEIQRIPFPSIPSFEYESEDNESDLQKKDDHFDINRISDVPHHVLIAYQELYCSGSLIKSKIVVTAASCFVKMTTHTTVIVKVGSSIMTGLGQVIEVLEVKKHEYFGQSSDLDNDIALLVLKDHVEFSNRVKKIPLREDQDSRQVGTTVNVRVCGWGSTNLAAQFNTRLLCSDMTVINSTNCWKLYKTFLNKGNFCVKYHHDCRLSDNGGSVVNNEQLIGVVSYGVDREKPPYIALATNVTYYYRWINVNVRRFLEKYCLPVIEN